MGRYLLRRVALIPVTLAIVSILVFVLSEVLPGNVARTILGPFATGEQVADLNAELGYDRPILVRYFDWVAGFITGDWGESVVLRVPIRPLVLDRLLASLKLGAIAFALTVPLSIGFGVLAGLRKGRFTDRAVSIIGLSLIAIPEFVSGVVLLIVFAVSLQWFPVSAQAPAGAGLLTQLHYLILPALPLVLVLFGYIARMAREGTAAALESDYVRTAVLKGMPSRRVVSRHVLRNALLPTVTVVGSQLGYLVGGLVVIETLFNYNGLGKLLLDSAIDHDVPVLGVTALVVALIYMLSNLLADLTYSALNPRIRYAAA